MKKPKYTLCICYYYERHEGERNAFNFISIGDNDIYKEAKKYIKDNYDNNVDYKCNFDVYLVDKEDDIKGKTHKITIK